jgi:hypothetical protein
MGETSGQLLAAVEELAELCLSLHVSSIVEMPHLLAIEVSHSRQIPPLFKAHFLQQLETCLIAFQDNREEMPDLNRRTCHNGMLDQRRRDPTAMMR